MENKGKIIREIFIVAASVILLLVYNCTADGPCEGYLRVVNPIPDTTVVVGDTLFIDLADPFVFESSKGNTSFLPAVTYGFRYLGVNAIYKGEETILLVIGKEKGNGEITVFASDDCLENKAIFKVSILEK